MIYLVVGEESDYDYSVHKNFYATSSLKRAEEKLKEVQTRAVIISAAQRDYSDWCRTEPFKDNPYPTMPPLVEKMFSFRREKLDVDHPEYVAWRARMEQYQAKQKSILEQGTALIAAKHGLTVEEMNSGNGTLEYSIEEVPSDDDD